ncbi:LuxR C-terminal-related transcriptional regulator [Symbioplanes lichenis]|uniref:LuxR C-terminal-related transcriptional regulator n=1 Tax=Symbioplanes lichenis TaxID=1629072 RepID=UPI00273A5292|nr:LuxR C-terminal-related transcriptional regulator [Actinoplanes lichenis]
MVLTGLLFGLVEYGAREWWLAPVCGVLLAVLAAVIVSRRPRPARAVPRTPSEPLSLRELEVLRALADGRSNREIAATLYVAPCSSRSSSARPSCAAGPRPLWRSDQ